MSNPLVVDIGSGNIKAGFAQDIQPRTVFPSIVGKSRHYSLDTTSSVPRKNFVGDEAQKRRGILNIKYPIEHGIVTNWDSLIEIFHYLFNKKLQLETLDQPILLTEPPLNPKSNKEKMTQAMFETFDVPYIYVATQAVLSLRDAGKTTGIVFDCGDGVSHTVAVYENEVIRQSVNRIKLAGRDLTDYLMRLFDENGIEIVSSANREIAREIKEKHCYVAQNYQQELASRPRPISYELSIDDEIEIGDERFSCPEALFNPSLMGMTSPGSHELICNSIKKCDTEIRGDLYSNVVLSGGTTMIPGFPERIKSEIAALAPRANVQVFANNDRSLCVWRGGKELASHSTFEARCISRREYSDEGPSIVHRKCNDISLL